jgi:hypothetical protein
MKCTHCKKANVNANPVHTRKAYKGNRVILPCLHNLSNRWESVVNFIPWPVTPGKTTLLPTDQDAAWAPEPVWIFWTREKSSPYTGSNPTLSTP